jgi:hypothetical protein
MKISKKITIISITLMLFVSLVPTISAHNIEAGEVGIQKGIQSKELVNNEKITENLKKTTKRHIKNQIQEKMQSRKDFSVRKYERPKRLKRQLRLRKEIQGRNMKHRVRAYRNRTDNFKGRNRKRVNRRFSHYHPNNK